MSANGFRGIVEGELILGVLSGAVSVRSVRGKEMIVITVTYENKKRDHIFARNVAGTGESTVGDILRSNYLKSDEVMRLIDEDVVQIEIRNSEKKKPVLRLKDT